MKNYLYLFILFLFTSCIKDRCYQEVYLPVDFKVDSTDNFSYVDVSVGSKLLKPYTHQVYHAWQGFEFKELLNITEDHIQESLPGDPIYIVYKTFCLDGSFRVERDTLIKGR